MKPILNSLTQGKIQALSRRLVEHRRWRGAGCHPTPGIWEEAVSLCEEAPLSQVARGIGVSPNGLRNWKKRARPLAKKVPEPRPLQFLEVRGLAAAVPVPPTAPRSRVPFQGAEGSRQVELTRDDGSRLRIADPGAHGVDLRVLIHGFLSLPGTSASSPREGALR